MNEYIIKFVIIFITGKKLVCVDEFVTLIDFLGFSVQQLVEQNEFIVVNQVCLFEIMWFNYIIMTIAVLAQISFSLQNL